MEGLKGKDFSEQMNIDATGLIEFRWGPDKELGWETPSSIELRNEQRVQ